MSVQHNQISVIEPGVGGLVDVLGAPIMIKSTGRADQLFFADHPMPPGYGVPLHVHADEDELFYILDGEITLDAVDGSTTVRPGSFVHLPRGVAHGFRNVSDIPARMLVVTTPGGALEGVFRGLDAASRGDEPLDPGRIGAICASNRLAML
jgi:mannose-6-phosphate isomerase-like protein (cupin superfamily)